MLPRALTFPEHAQLQDDAPHPQSLRRIDGRVTFPRPERSYGVRGPTHRAAPILAALAIGVAGVVWAGCGGSNDEIDSAKEEASKVLEEGREKLDNATKEGEKALKEANSKGNEAIDKAEKQIQGSKAGKEAEKKLEEGKEKANEAIDQAEEDLKNSGY